MALHSADAVPAVKTMLDFFLILSVTVNIGFYITVKELRARLDAQGLDIINGTPGIGDIPRRRRPKPEDVVPRIKVGVTPETLEGLENNMHRKPPFPKIP